MLSVRRKGFQFTLLIIFVVASMTDKGECIPAGKLPNDIKLCKKDDPLLNDCLKSLFETLRPRMMEGIPEIDLPPLDPLILKEVVVLHGGHGQMRAVGHDIKITGISNFEIRHLKVNVEELEIDVSVYFPYLRYEGTYDVDAKFINLPVRGKGPMKGNATEITGNALLKGKFAEVNGEKYVEFTSAAVDVTIKDYSIRVDKLFPDKNLNDAINALLNDRKMQSMATAKPIANKLAAKMILEMVNKIASKLSFEEVFE